MKAVVLVFIFAFSSFLLTGVSRAQMAEDEKEKQFELEEETVQIHDTQAERQAAKEEAQHQEKIEKERKRELGQLQVKKKREQEVTNKQLAGYRDRIVKSEKKRKAYDTEIAQLEKDIQKMKTQVASSEEKAKNSEVAQSDANKILNQKRQEKLELIKRQTKAYKNTATAENEIRKLKIQYARLEMETRQLEGHLKMIEEVEAKKEAEREKMQRNVSSMQDRKKAADDAIRAHQGSK